MISPRFLLYSLIITSTVACGALTKSDTNTAVIPLHVASDATVPSELIGSEWILIDLAGVPVLPDHKPTLIFSQGRISGNGSCNHFSGSVVIEDNAFKKIQILSTLVGCIQVSANQQETEYLDALATATHYAYKQPYLLIYTKNSNKPLRFIRKTTTNQKP